MKKPQKKYRKKFVPKKKVKKEPFNPGKEWEKLTEKEQIKFRELTTRFTQCDMNSLLQSISQENSVREIGEGIMGGIVHDLVFESRGLAAEFMGLVEHHGARLEGHGRADILPPEREDKGHSIQNPQGKIVFLGRYNIVKVDIAIIIL